MKFCAFIQPIQWRSGVATPGAPGSQIPVHQQHLSERFHQRPVTQLGISEGPLTCHHPGTGGIQNGVRVLKAGPARAHGVTDAAASQIGIGHQQVALALGHRRPGLGPATFVEGLTQ